ncbi:MAG: hypothetical protein RMY62_013350 [Nostoc sp. ZfuVER08]|nr:hypothetical protein [Nostoc sp. ZfuVER08]
MLVTGARAASLWNANCCNYINKEVSAIIRECLESLRSMAIARPIPNLDDRPLKAFVAVL